MWRVEIVRVMCPESIIILSVPAKLCRNAQPGRRERNGFKMEQKKEYGKFMIC